MTVTLTDCVVGGDSTLDANIAAGAGGGIAVVDASGHLTITRSAIKGNQANPNDAFNGLGGESPTAPAPPTAAPSA